MKRQGELVDPQTLNQDALSWLIDLLVKKPLSWSASYLFSKDFSNQADQYVFMPVVKELCDKIESEHKINRIHNSDDILTLSDFTKLIQKVRGFISSTDLDIILKYMKVQGKLQMSEVKGGTENNLLIKMTRDKKKSITDNCIGIFKIKCSLEKIDAQINEISEQIEKIHKQAAIHLKSNNKQMAVLSLKREKMLKELRNKRYQSFSMIDEVLLKIKTSQLDVEVIDVMEIASKTLKNVLNENNISPERVNQAIDNIQDTLADQKEIDDALHQGFDQINQIDEEELEKELSNLIESPKAPSSDEIIELLDSLDIVTDPITTIESEEKTKMLTA